MKHYLCCKHCGAVKVFDLDGDGPDTMEEMSFCEKCAYEHDRDMRKGYKNLKTLFDEYNKHDFLFDEEGLLELGATYDFRFTVQKGERGTLVRVYDKKEVFNINYDDEIAACCYAAAKEFGFTYKRGESKVDKMMSEISEAIKKDFKVNDVTLEWEDGVVMSAWLAR